MDFAAHLRHQHAVLETFVALLEREGQLLAQTPLASDAFADVTETKRRLAAELETLEDQRRTLVAAHGYPPDSAGTTRLVETLGYAESWQAFIALVTTARAANQANGLAIQQRLDFANQALAILRHGTEATLYAANGRRQQAVGRRIDSGA
jgi:flagellar biosynthesis/type III secretory pathway chaperone